MDFEKARENMVAEQLVPRGISDSRVLDAFRSVPRHEFVPPKYSQDAYCDYPLPVGRDQTISQPYMVALMTELLRLKAGDKVLEIGTGSGYQMAILSRIAGAVYSVERIPELADAAEATLKRLGYDNCFIRTGDGTMGWPENAPYDGIIVTAGSPEVPRSLISQLAEGARLVIPVGGQLGQVLTVVRKKDASADVEEVCGCVFVPLIGKEGWTIN